MKNSTSHFKRFYIFFLLTLFLLVGFTVQAQVSVPFSPRLPGTNLKVRGDMTILSNNILNTRIAGPSFSFNPSNPMNAPWDPNISYNDRDGDNQALPMVYIDIDTDTSTFSSSSSNLNAPTCSRVVYAGLYWGGSYPFNSGNANGRTRSADPFPSPTDPNPAIDPNRDQPYESVKFKVPGGSYVDIGPSSSPIFEYQKIYDKNGDLDQNGTSDILDIDDIHSPYLNYANVTSLLSGLGTSPNGEYTVANVVGALERKDGGNFAGWTLVVIYENQSLTSKYISTFDGFASISNVFRTANFSYNGFRTLPGTLPVNASIGVSAMEGDSKKKGPRIAFKANSSSAFTLLSDPLNPIDNFFNSTISNNGSYVSSRNPASENTLGWDTDMFRLNNPFNNVLPNDETGAEVEIRLPSGGDITYLFLNTISVDIIEPQIILEKQVKDIAGNDISSVGVNLGQTLDYVLLFRNIGNDDAVNYTIRDVLPANTNFIGVDLSGAPGATHSYNPTTNEVSFTIPDELIEQGDPKYNVRIQVRVADNCFDFVDACSDIIENIAFSTYSGILNTSIITDDPSVSSVTSCALPVSGTTNFLLDDISLCDFSRTVQLCGASLLLNAGTGFDNYLWVRDNNGNNTIDPSDTMLQNGPLNILTVTSEGTYIVNKTIASTCKNLSETFNVNRFGMTNTNPIIDFFNDRNSDGDATNNIQGEVVSCSVDGDLLPRLFLCGSGDSELLQVNIPDAVSLSWELLDEASCTAAPTDCATKNLSCTWNQVGTGDAYLANVPGKYRLIINYTAGCFSRFYFNIFQNNLAFDYAKRDIFCSTNGSIAISGLGANYGYQLLDIASGTILVPFSSDNGPNFDITANGAYRVEIVQLDGSRNPIPDACIFSTPDIGILDRDINLDITTTPANCDAQGSIQIDALNVRPDYTYILRLADGTFIDDETAQPSNSHTFNVNPGDYIIEVTTADGCSSSQNVLVERTPDPTVSAVTIKDIGCSEGEIELTPTGGFSSTDYSYAIWRKNGVGVAAVRDIPSSNFQSTPIFTFGWRDTDADGINEYFSGEDGSYIFVIVDPNNCFSFSNPVTISDNGAMTIVVNDDNFVSCSGSNDAAVTLVASGGIGPFTYSIDGGVTTQITPSFVGLPAATYPISVTDSSGCTITFDHIITEPFPLSASAGISSDATCNPLGGEVRITNIVGGTSPYEFSFDGGASYSASTIEILPPGTYTIIVRDATNCEFPIIVTVNDTPTPPGISLTPDVNYNCTGSGTITATASNPSYNYTYELNGVPNAPDPTSNIFLNVPPGTYTVRTNYVNATPPMPSLLLSEDFGFGNGTIPSPNTFGYFYEDQTTGTHLNQRPGDTNTSINDFEYSVTNNILTPFGNWENPNDHTDPTNPNGRYLIINVGTPSPGQIVYSKIINDIIPNRPLSCSLYIFNLIRGTSSKLDPDLTIEIREIGTLNVIASIRTGDIPKNTGPDDWAAFSTTLDPGANTSLEFVIRSEKIGNSGNDFALDDLTIFQNPEVCELFVDTPVTVVSGRVFEGNSINSTNVSCNGLSDGTITFEAENFDTTAGFEYSVDGGTNWINSTISPVTTGAIFGAGNHTILMRKADEISCLDSITTVISEPAIIVTNAAITTSISCTNSGATIKANTTGGLPVYEYQLEDITGSVIIPYQASNTFTSLTSGDYIVRTRDNNFCEDPIDVALTVAPTNNIVFDINPTTCYSGANDASIIVNVTNGNGEYTFSINGNPWVVPSPATATTHTFDNLASGNYTINVSDGSGCIGTPQSITIDPLVVASVDVNDISSCADGSITTIASGGDSNFFYAFVRQGTAVTAADFSGMNTFTVAVGNDGNYDVYVRDNNAIMPYCEYRETVTVAEPSPITFTSTPTDPVCYNGVGTIEVNITSGDLPYTLEIIDLDNGGVSDQINTGVIMTSQTYFNLNPGNYTIQVTDSNGCTISDTPIAINNPDELTGNVIGITPSTCSGNPSDFGFEFITYTNTLGILEFSADGGTTWTGDSTNPGVSDHFTGYTSGDTVFPSMRTVSGGTTLCRTDLPPFIIPFPLDDLDISVSAVVVNCNELQVTVLGNEGTPNYQYTYSEDPAHFNSLAPVHPWEPIPATDNATPHTFTGLTPGRTYVFYVRDNSGPPACVRQSNVNVNDLITNPLEITSASEPSCAGASDGNMTFTITDKTAPFSNEFRWTVFDISGGTPVVVSNSGGNQPFVSPQNVVVNNLPAGNYFIDVVEVNGGIDSCRGASENMILNELDPITASLNKLSDISCNNPGLIEIRDILGGGGTFTYTVSGPTSFATITGTPDNPISIPSNSPAGAYNVTITDQYGCFSDLGFVNLELTANPTIDSMVVNNCASPTSLTINATSTAPQILYSIDGGTTYVANGGVFNNLTVGTYHVAIIDSNGCTDTNLVEIFPVLEASVSLTKLIDCTVTPDAEISIEASFGSGNYDYEITSGLGSLISRTTLPSNPYIFTSSIADDYTITIFDNGTAMPECHRVFTVNVPPVLAPLFAETHTAATCYGDNNGTITLNETSNGINPLSYAISPIAGTFNASANIFEGLPGGTYTITGTGTNGCTFDIVGIVIDEPNIINIPTPIIQEFGCALGNNINNASITINATGILGGSGTYLRYEFINDNGTVSIGDDFVVQDGANHTYTETNLTGGTYRINVYDDNGCLGMQTAAIAPFEEISNPMVTITQDITCNPAALEEIQVSSMVIPAIATPNIEYTTIGTNVIYNQTNTTGTFVNMGIGAYAITITNLDTGCTISTTHEILDPNIMRAVATKLTDEDCLNNGVADGSFEIAINNFSGNYSYQVFDNSNAPVLGAGFSGTSTTVTPLIISNLPGGIYYVRITETDAPFCEDDSNLITIIEPEFPISATVSQQASPSCTNDKGSILVDPEGGVKPYTITLTNTTTAQVYTETNVEAFIFSRLSGGDYNINITDSKACAIVNTVTLITPDALIPSITSTPLVCFNGNTGSVSASVNLRNITPNYLYKLNKYDETGTTILSTSANQGSNIFIGLNTGFYSITVNDDVLCSEETPIVQIINPSEVASQLIRTSPLTCTTGVELELSATGGSGTYEYSLNSSSWISMTGNSVLIPNASITGPLGAGTYRYYVRDAVNGCSSVLSNEISEDNIEPLLLLIDRSAAFITCNGESTAEIKASAEGGLGNYMFELFTDVSLNSASRIAGPQAFGEFSNLNAGTYYVNVLSDDCSTAAQQVMITEPTPLDYTDTVTHPLCFGDENGIISVTLSGGVGGYQYAISPNLNQFDTKNTFEELAPGNYTVIAQDKNGCFVHLDYTITEPELLTAFGVATPEVCAGNEDGTITLSIVGGTAPYRSRLSDEANFVQDRTTLTDLSAGDYIIFIQDANGCQADILINVESGVNLNAMVTPVYECTGNMPNNYVNIALEDPAYIGDVLYALDSTNALDLQLNPDFRNITPGSHYIAIAHANGCIQTIDFEIEDFEPLTLSLDQSGINTIVANASGGLKDYTFYFGDLNNGIDNTYTINRTDTYLVTVVDENGCEVTVSIFVEFIDIEIPNFFSPDGDGLNDVWMPRNQEAFPNMQTIIFDRYGREVYRFGNKDSGWGGSYHETELPSGDYWYIIKLNGENDTREFLGHFTLYR